MGNRLFIGNLSWDATEDELCSFLGPSVTGVKIINDRETGRSRGFGFAEAIDDDSAAEVMAEFDGKAFRGRDLRINEAAERPQRSGGGRGRSSDGGGGHRPTNDGGFRPEVEDRRGRRGKRRQRGDDFGGGHESY